MENYEEGAPEDVRKSYSRIHNASDEYLSALQDNMFRQGFRFGYRYRTIKSEEKSLQSSSN